LIKLYYGIKIIQIIGNQINNSKAVYYESETKNQIFCVTDKYMSGYKEYHSDLIFTYPRVHRVPLKRATKKNFKKYGRFVDNYKNEKVILVQWKKKGWRDIMDGTGLGGGVAEGRFEYEWKDNKLYSTNHAVGGNYVTGILPWEMKNRTSVLTREANYHPDGGQVFHPITKKPFILLLALPRDDIQLEDFIAFYFDGTCGVQIFPNIWHQPVYPIDDQAVFMTKQGKVHACVGVDTLEEFNTWLEIPLVLK
tara:strand:+ start:375 stop:1127 length:753 start_codon:yes stop_codon:yes gene_type:complete